MMQKIMNFIKDEDGLELSEYAVMGGLIILGVVLTVGLLAGEIDRVLGLVEEELADVGTTPTPTGT